ncbi:MAG: ATP-binding protein, partial [Candidatus Hodarchaeota archaeon]
MESQNPTEPEPLLLSKDENINSSLEVDNEDFKNKENNSQPSADVSNMLGRTRILDYVSMKGLSTLTGCSAEYWDTHCLKELTDNALDACADKDVENPCISISIKTDDMLKITVSDNGNDFTYEKVKKISDFSHLYSTKHHVKAPTRGIFGNAMKVLMGIPYAVATEMGKSAHDYPLCIRSSNKEYNIKLEINQSESEVKAVFDSKDVEFKNTEVILTLPIYRPSWGYKQEYIDLLLSYTIFNPDNNFYFKLEHPDYENKEFKLPFIGEKKKEYIGNFSIHWYSFSEFRNYVFSLIRELASKGKDIKITDFLRMFRGLSSPKKIKDLIKKLKSKEHKINYLSDMKQNEDYIRSIYNLLKSNSNSPNPSVLGQIGKDALLNHIKHHYGEPTSHSYKIKKDTHINADGVHIPFVLEVLVAEMPNNIGLKRKIHFGINHSPCIQNPFERYVLWWTPKTNKLEAHGVTGLLEKYKIKKDEPVIVIIHLISPGINYTNNIKSEIEVEPFIEALSNTLYKACKFYASKSKNRKVGKKSNARQLLIKELKRRDKLLKEIGSIPNNERVTQQGLFYIIRKQMKGNPDILRDSFISSINDECSSLGRTREELGIYAAVRAEMYFRGEVYPINYSNIEELAQNGSDILLIEKEGIALAVEPYAHRKGVALINSRGFIVEYAEKLINLSELYDANVFQLTDFDASGLVISMKVPNIQRLGVDYLTVTNLGLNISDVEETYEAPSKHLKKLSKEMQEKVKDKRIEIDSILAEVGPERFWEYLENEMLKYKPIRDLTRSIDLEI